MWIRLGTLLAVAAVAGTLIVPPAPAVGASDVVISVGDATVVEGTSTKRNLLFAVTLDRPAMSTVSVKYRVARLDATPGADFTAPTALRTLTFKVGANGTTPVSKYVAVKVLPDAADEADERLSLLLSDPVGGVVGRGEAVGTVFDDDPIAPGFRVSVGDASLVEGHQGTRDLKFTVSLSQPVPSPVSVRLSVERRSATDGPDFEPGKPKTLTFKPGPSGLSPVAKTVSVKVTPDDAAEGPETFAVVLSEPSIGVLLSRARGIGTVIDDEPDRRPLMGTAVRWPTLATDTAYREVAGRRFDLVAPENEMKWDATEPQRGAFNFGAADAIVDVAREYGEQVHGHALVWHSQNPSWLTAGDYSRAELIEILTEHVTALVSHFRGDVTWWDVANEVVDEGGAPRASIWQKGIGPDHLDIAFAAARAADPAARLFLNDYAIEGSSAKSDGLFAVASDLVARGVPIDGVGFQVHVTPGSVTEADLAAEFTRYAGLGLDVAVTELDVRIPVPASPSALSAQAATYRAVLAACTGAPNCTSFTTWGFTDRYSWIPSWFPGMGAALPWDDALAPKPAYDELEASLRN